ncbi:MAG TPA: pitrilysin family protein, partial [Myxococcota bacterium]|nr:pitrilysin family protein [Myxococcota bacterium]
MKNYKLLIAILSLGLLSLLGCRSIGTKNRIDREREEIEKKETWRSQLPIADTTPTRPTLPKIRQTVLSNGLTVIVVEDSRLPIAQINLVLKAGSAQDPYGYAGLSHLTALMLKEGTKKKTGLELAEDLANLGTELSVNVAKDLTQFSSAVLTNKVEDVVSLIAAMVQEPRMAEDDFARVKLLQKSALASEQGVLTYVAQTTFLMAAYGEKHPYAFPSGGTLKTVSHIELKDIKKAHASYYGSNIAALIAVGDVTLGQITALAKQHFGTWKKTSSVK